MTLPNVAVYVACLDVNATYTAAPHQMSYVLFPSIKSEKNSVLLLSIK